MKYLIWWTNQNDCERIAPLDTWPSYIYDEYRSRCGRSGRGRLWIPRGCEDAPSEAAWNDQKWTCQAAADAGGIVIKAEHLRHVQFLPGFITNFDMELPPLTAAKG